MMRAYSRIAIALDVVDALCSEVAGAVSLAQLPADAAFLTMAASFWQA